MAPNVQPPLTPEGMYPHLFPPCPQLSEVQSWVFEPLVAKPKVAQVLKWMIKEAKNLVPAGSLGENVDAVASTKATLSKILRTKSPYKFNQRITQGWKIGRLHGEGSTQCLYEGFRNEILLLAHPECVDIDQKKSQPTSLAKDIGPKAGAEIPNVEYYVDNSDDILDGKPPNTKRLFNRCLYLGSIDAHIQDPDNGLNYDDPVVTLADKFRRDVETAALILGQAMPEMFAAAKAEAVANPRKPNPLATFLSWVLGQCEARSLCVHVVNAKELGWHIIDLIFDGFISNEPYPNARNAHLTRMAAGTVHTLCCKAFNRLVQIPPDVLEDPEPREPFACMMHRLLKVAHEKQYSKAGGTRIFEPVDGIPCAFRKTHHSSYAEFVDEAVGNEEYCLYTPKMLPRLAEQLQNHKLIAQFPEHKPTPGVWAFRDGIFDAKTMRFIPTDEIPDGVVAQHYFDMDYPTGDFTTMHPYFDQILRHQYGQHEGVTEMVYVLLGKTILPVMFKDEIVGFVYIYGIRGTGKSTFIRIIKALVPNSGDIQDVPDSHFCLADLHDCSTVVSEDADAKTLKAALPVTVLNKMCEGGKVSINKNNQHTSQVDKWDACIAIASNSPWPWAEDGVVRRVMPLFNLTPVSVSDISFDTHIKPELPYILLHSLHAHQEFVDKYGHLATPPLPRKMAEWREKTVLGNSPLALFLVEGGEYVDKRREETVRVTVEKDPEAVTLQQHFLDAFKGWSQRNYDTSPTMNVFNDVAVFSNAGFSTEKKVRVLANTIDPTAPERARRSGSREGRQVNVIQGMRLSVKRERPGDNYDFIMEPGEEP